MSPEALRTPEERFTLLPAFKYLPHYIDTLPGFSPLRMAYVDEGRAETSPDKLEQDVFLCLHGEPTWSYLFRKMIPVFVNAGHRAVAPDLFGFGRSDKPIEDSVYGFDFHRDSIIRFIELLDLNNITLVVQDWGGILGLTIPMDMPQRFKRLLVMNTAIPIGEPLSDGFAKWKGFAAKAPEIPVSGLIAADAWSAVNLMDALAYDAPYPDNSYKAGVRRFPQMVPIEPGMEGADLGVRAREFWSKHWQGESFMAIGMRDQVLGKGPMTELGRIIRNCPAPLDVPEAGHFVQEYGKDIAEQALKHFNMT